jgi:radical SAM protein with 4Fe4S-binding SPASM domain
MSKQRLYRRLDAPVSVQIEVTQRCPCECVHCYNYWRRCSDLPVEDGGNKDLTPENAERVIEQCLEAQLFHAVVTGGEPLLNFSIVKQLVSKLSAEGISVSLNSNLVLMDREKAQWLAEHQVGVLTSVLGPEKVHDSITQLPGSYARTIEGYKLYAEVGRAPYVNMVVMKQNAEYVRETAEFLHSLGCQFMSASGVVCPAYCRDFSEYQLGREELMGCLNELIRIRDSLGFDIDILNPLPVCALHDSIDPHAFASRRCGAGLFEAAIGCDGGVRPCPHHDSIEGNLFEEDLKAIWSRMTRWRSGELIPETCRECKLLFTCGGGCRYAAKKHSGAYNGCDPHMQEERVDEVFAILADKKTAPAVIASERFRVNQFRSRPEEFGALVAVGGNVNDIIFLSHQADALLKGLRPGDVMSVSEFGDSPQHRQFLTGLAERGVVEYLPSCAGSSSVR